MTTNRIKIESKDSDNNDVVVYVVRPTRDQQAEAQIIANKTFAKAVMNGAPVKLALEEILKKQGIWNDDKQKELDDYNEKIREKLIKLKGGKMKLNEGRQLAVDIRVLRMQRTELLMERNAYDEYTAENLSENAKFDYLVSVCTVKEDGSPYFESVDDYKDNTAAVGFEAAAKLATMIHGLDEKWESELPENKFLAKYKFVDEDLRLVDKDGNYVTVDGKQIDEQFRYVKDGKFVDADGNLVDDDGLPVVEFSPFTDDDGNPVE